MRHRSRRSPRFSLTSTQRQTIFAVTQSLPPLQRHSFLLHVSHTLRLSSPPGFVSDVLINHAIERALGEVAA